MAAVGVSRTIAGGTLALVLMLSALRLRDLAPTEPERRPPNDERLGAGAGAAVLELTPRDGETATGGLLAAGPRAERRPLPAAVVGLKH